MGYRIRALTGADELIVWEMLRYAAHEPSVEAVQHNPLLARYAIDWGRDGDRGSVAILGERAIGAAWLRLWPGPNKGFGHLRDDIPELAIAVLPEYCGQGIGTELLRQTLAIARDHAPAVSLSVRENNPALGLYERAGFVKVPGSEVINRTGGRSLTLVCEFEKTHDD